MTVLFVCTGNVARSQIAETMFNHLSCQHQAASAGTAVRHLDAEGQTVTAWSERPDAPPAPGLVLSLMREQVFDLSNNVVNEVTPDMVEAADRIILMRGRIPPEDFLALSDKLEEWDISDPVRASRETVAITMEDVIQRVEELIQELG